LNALLATERNNATHYRQALADLAHALKTPLAVLRARLESNDRDGSDRPKATDLAVDETLNDMELILRRQLERAARSTRRTLTTPVAVLPVLQRLATSLTRLYSDDKVSFDVDGDPVSLRIDERDLMELCGNLMDNAAKYGKGRVVVRAASGASGSRSPGVDILIEDNGPGIEVGRFEALLQRGARGDEQREGQGLGLAIARQLIEAYGGSIHLDRSQLGGAALRISFPPR
jgi:two-component system sensor histidine kinase PhoQ